MKKLFAFIIAASLIFGLIFISGFNVLNPRECIAADLGPVVAMGTPLVMMSKNSEMVIMGTGFKPDQDLNILFTAPDGLQSDIISDLKPKPKADKTGSWATTWSAGRYVSQNLITGGAYKIVVTDSDFNDIAHIPVFFQKPKEDKEKKKEK